MFTSHKFDSLLSTNLTAKKYPINSIIIAKIQTKGKGRFKRSWESSLGGLYISLVVKPIDNAPLINTLAASIAVKNTIKKSTSINPTIKWPNDLYVEDKKICGILSESANEKVIIGIGININNSVNLPTAIAIKDILQRRVNVQVITNTLITEFEKISTLSKEKIIQKYRKQIMIGKSISVKTKKGKVSGEINSIDDDGFLILRSKGKKVRIVEGDII